MLKFRFAVIAAALTLASSSVAQEIVPSTGGQAIGGIVEALGLRKPPPPAPDFVRDSRPERMEYAPFAATPERTGKKRAAEMRARGVQLDRAVAENRRKAARIKIPD